MLKRLKNKYRRYYDRRLYEKTVLDCLKREKIVRALDVGSGPQPRNDFGAQEVYGVDIRTHGGPYVRRCDLNREPLPYEDGCFNLVTAYDVLEHIVRVQVTESDTRFPFVNLMNEIWRVLAVGGFFFSSTPAYPSKAAFQDPTHVNFLTEDTMNLYFCEKAWARIYGFQGVFSMAASGWRGEHHYSLIRKASDRPIARLDFIQE